MSQTSTAARAAYAPVLAPRVVRSFVQRIAAPPEDVFPLLCPVLEKEWFPGWDHHMIHSQSGVAEPGAVFETAHAGGRTLWVITEHDAPRRVAFVRWHPDGMVVHLEISLGRHLDGDTALCITYTHTATDAASADVVGKLRESDWLDTMARWEGSLNAWFEKRRPRAAAGR